MYKTFNATRQKPQRRSLRDLLVLALAWLLLPPFGFDNRNTIATGQTAASARQKTYSTPEEAVDDLTTATKTKDRALLLRIFGPDLEDLMSGDAVQEAKELETFTGRLAEKSQLVKETDNKYVLNLGLEEWPFPIPLIKEGARWSFNTAEGVEELLNRRIGANEIQTISVCRAYAQAQWEYFLEGDWDNDLVQEFAQKLGSSPGQKDGLYWPTTPQEDPSPLGALVASARSAGYLKREQAADAGPQPYYGYYYKILNAQGRYAPGGAYSYVINGNMIGGFALVAYPANYGSSGVMTFIVNQQGRVYQKNLGESTSKIGGAMNVYDPDASWKVAEESVAQTPAPTQSDIAGRGWRITEIDSAPVTSTGDRALTLRLDADTGRFTAFGGVNQIGGVCALDGNRVTFTQVTSTRRAGPEKTMKQEAAFTKCLEEIVSVKRTDGHLVLCDETGRERLRLTRTDG